MLGYSKEDMVGKQTPAMLHLKSELDVRAAQLSAELKRPVEGFKVFVEKAEHQGSETRGWTYVHKDGHYVPISLVVTPMRDSAGKTIGYLGIGEDITERQRAEKLKMSLYRLLAMNFALPLPLYLERWG